MSKFNIHDWRNSQIKKQLTKMNVPYKELLNGMVIPDAAKMTAL